MSGPRSPRVLALLASAALVGTGLVGVLTTPASATTVTDGASFTTAWQNSATTQISLSQDVTLTCTNGEPTRNSSTAISVDGNGHTITQTCAGTRIADQQGTGALAFADVTLTGGDGSGGGAINSEEGNISITDSTVTANHSGEEGGALQTNSEGTVTVLRSVISDNSSEGSGGAIGAQGLTTITDSTMSGNSSGNNGGAIRAYGGATIVNSTLSGNSADSDGGAIDGGPVTLVYATVVDNTGQGGANLSLDGTSWSTFGSVIALPHTAPNCAGASSTDTSGYNVDDDGSCGLGGGPGDHSDLTTSLALCPLADNGGPAPTRLPAATSPLVDQIPKAACDAGQSITTDERGVTRPYGSACDIGAVEYAPVQSTTTTAPGSTTTVAAEPVTVNPQFTG